MKGKFWKVNRVHSYSRLTQSQIDEIQTLAQSILVHPWNVSRDELRKLSVSEQKRIEKEFNNLLLSFQKLVSPEWVLSLIQSANEPETQKDIDLERELL